MESRENKFGLGLVLFIVLAVGGMMRLFGFFEDDSKPQDVPEISYEMPRPKDTLVGDFALSGREIDRQYVNPFAKIPNGKKDLKPAVPAPVKPVAKAAAPPATAPQGTWYKNPAMQVKVVDRDQRGGSGGPSPEVGTPGARPAPNDQEDRGPANNDADRRSPGQWRSLLFANPTKENMDKFIDAFEKKQVDAATFYSVTEELLKSGKKDDETLALYGLNKVGTAQAFRIVAQDYGSLPQEMRAAGWQTLMAYGALGRHQTLLQAVQGGSNTVAILGAQVILASLKGGSGGTTGGTNTGSIDTRGVRGSSAQSGSSYAGFTSIVTQWASSGNAELAQAAQSILPLLQNARA